jgi:superoxide dismutase, Fe-Mn family
VEQISDLQGNVGNGSVPPLAFDTREHASCQDKNVKVDAFAALWLIS